MTLGSWEGLKEAWQLARIGDLEFIEFAKDFGKERRARELVRKDTETPE
jgi:hypothetical protein